MICTVEGCGNQTKALGLCQNHYMRQRRNGSPTVVKKRLGPTPAPPEERFWRHVQKANDCWIWTGGKSSRGYGNFSRGRKSDGQVRAHRYSWELHNGAIPRGLLVCHKCDNPTCVNPDHLFLGTNTDNMRDAARKGRTSRKPKYFKLAREDVAEIRRRLAAGETQQSVADSFDVSKACIGKINRGLTWVG